MRVDIKALTISYLAFICIYLLVYIPLNPIAPYLPYIAVTISGSLLARYTKNALKVNTVILTLLISLSFGMANYFGPSDFPGLKATGWVIGISIPIVLFLVIAGQGLNEIVIRMKSKKNDSNKAAQVDAKPRLRRDNGATGL